MKIRIYLHPLGIKPGNGKSPCLNQQITVRSCTIAGFGHCRVRRSKRKLMVESCIFIYHDALRSQELFWGQVESTSNCRTPSCSNGCSKSATSRESTSVAGNVFTSNRAAGTAGAAYQWLLIWRPERYAACTPKIYLDRDKSKCKKLRKTGCWLFNVVQLPSRTYSCATVFFGQSLANH